MSHDRQHGEVIFTCDMCDDYIETQEKNFLIAKEFAVEEGWKIFFDKESEEFKHICSGCSDDLTEEE